VAAVLRLAVAPTAAAQGARRPTRVLLVYQQQAEAQPMLEFTERLRATVRRELGSPVEFYQEALDLDRFGSREYALAVARYFNDKYRGLAVDVVVPAGRRALQFAVDRSGDVLRGVPIVFALNAAPQVDPAALPAHVTGRFAAASRFEPTLAMARALQPDAQQVVVVGGAGASDSVTVAAVVRAAAVFRDTLALTVLQGLPLDVLLARLRQLPRRSIVVFANYRQNGQGQAFEPLDLVGSIARASPAPMYVQLRTYVGEGVVGGSVTRFDDEGVRTGRLVVRVLRRQPGEPMPPTERIPNVFVADWRQLRHWGLDERRLPPGTELRFREPTAWERYRSVILGALAIMAAQALLIGMLLAERGRRRRAQRALAEQGEYERTIAELTTDAVRHAPEDAPRALEDALARVGAYARADAAVLVLAADGPARPASRLSWMRRPGTRSDDLLPAVPSGEADAFRLELPLVVGRTHVGALELYRMRPGEPWPAALAARLGAAAEVIAGAIARSRAAAAAEEAQRQVAHLGRVAVVGELGSTISHELRQPLTGIGVNIQVAMRLLGRPRADIAQATAALADALADAGRASETIEQIRLMLRKQGPDATAVDLNEVSQHAASLLRRDAARRGARLDLALAPGLPPVRGNAVELRQVVLNLTLNALDAVAAVDGERRVMIGTVAAGDAVELFVRDTGPGLSPEVEARLFDPFFTTKAHGLGMGLAIVRSLVQQHGGHVTAENHAEGGTVFRIVLPADDRSADGAPGDGLAARATS
jgi:C4-dicarboxylate-specific signal transduction histidine kinase